MSEVNNLDHDLPPTIRSFQVDCMGQVTKKRYLGEFTCKIPTMKDQCLIDKHRAFLNGDFPSFLNPATLKVHEMVAYLRYTLTDYPKFWKESDLGYELRDVNVIREIYEKVIAFEEDWLKKLWGDQTEVESETEDSKQ